MLKRLSAMAGVLCILAATLCATVSAEDESTKTCTFPRVPDGSINVLDTQLDDLYENFEMQELVEQNLHAWPDALQTTTGKFWGCYDSEYVYLYIEITDTGVIDYTHEDPSQTWNRESIGVIFDFDYIREEEYEYNYANGDRICYFNLAGDFNNVGYHMYAPDSGLGLYEIIQSSTVKDTGDGRVLYELALPFPDDVEVKEGLKFGFEICAPNADSGERNSVISWSPEGQDMWHWSRCCGTAFLGAEIAAEVEAPAEGGADAPAESTPVTADAGIVAAAAVMAVAAGVVLSKKR